MYRLCSGVSGLRATRAAAALVAVLVALSGCGDKVSSGPEAGPDPAATTRAAPAEFTGAPYRSADELFAALDRAIGAETSVHQENGNLNPPPPAILDQEYGAAGSDLRHYVDLGPTEEDLAEMSPDDAAEFEDHPLVFLVYRVDGFLYAEGSPPLPMEDAEEQVGGPLLATLRSDVRTDFERLAGIASGLRYIGEEEVAGVPARRYEFSVQLDPDAHANPAIVPSEIRGPKKAEIWVGADDLPIRLDVHYGQQLGDIPGTGVSRTDYSRWSAPVDLDAKHLDWDRPEPAGVQSR